MACGARENGRSYQIISPERLNTFTTMPVTSKELEDAIRAAIQVEHVNVEDNSGGCGEKYFVLIVSKVVSFFPLKFDALSNSDDWTMGDLI